VKQNRIYKEIGKVGNISFAPIDATPDEFGLAMDAPVNYLNPERFLNKFGERLLVCNGVDTGTNNHDSGQRAFTSGSIQEGTPALGALLAATYGLSQPLPFLSFGGYDKTFDVAPLSRIGSSNVISALAFPNDISAGQDKTETYHTADTWSRIRQAQAERLKDVSTAQHLPKLRAAQEALIGARLTDGELRALKVPKQVDVPGLNGAQNVIRNGQLALAAFQSGLGVAANLEIGGFDTHGNHDTDHRRNMIQLLTAAGGLVDQIDALGMRDKVYLVIGSDFGRTPYNGEGAGSGKDHWPITSTLLLGPGIEGNRVLGATTADQLARPVDATTLQPSDSGIKISPAEIHAELRRVANLDPKLLNRFPVLGGKLRLLG
jgi:uncharacterized protein (DUF1501 family)